MQIQTPAAISSNHASAEIHRANPGKPAVAAPKEFEKELQAMPKCFIDDKCIRPIPGKPSVSIADFFQNDAKALVEDTLSDVRNDHPLVSNLAMQRFTSKLRGMTPGELDDVKDAIVAKMSSPDASQSDRNVLQKMYNLADAASENRQPDRPFPVRPRPFPIDEIPMPKPFPMPRHWDVMPNSMDQIQALNQKAQ
ncbi:MAG: hypothetical protein IV090_17880 [Candidatus Sericytochromatia bacterium]|nr:hypothetical protein [Candidatus Sericytochromatia bacterium]